MLSFFRWAGRVSRVCSRPLFENKKKDCSKCPHIDLQLAKAKYLENYAE